MGPIDKTYGEGEKERMVVLVLYFCCTLCDRISVVEQYRSVLAPALPTSTLKATLEIVTMGVQSLLMTLSVCVKAVP